MQKKVKPVVTRPLVIHVTNWAPGREVFRQFVEAHPELGLRYSENTYANFTRVHGPKLVELGVMRKSALRAPFTADVERFDLAAYELVSQYGYAEAEVACA